MNKLFYFTFYLMFIFFFYSCAKYYINKNSFINQVKNLSVDTCKNSNNSYETFSSISYLICNDNKNKEYCLDASSCLVKLYLSDGVVYKVPLKKILITNNTTVLLPMENNDISILIDNNSIKKIIIYEVWVWNIFK